MKKVLPVLVLIGLLTVPAISFVNADVAAEPPEGLNGLPLVVDEPQDIITLIDNIAQWIFIALLGIAGIFLVVAGFTWVTAGGNVESVAKARQMLIGALIGVAIGLGAKGLIEVVKGLLGYSG